MLKVLDLFSGIGGFSLGLHRTGAFETVAFCEINEFCQKVLAKNFPNIPIFPDVRTLDYDGTVDVITGGFPCQPFSTAGKRQGVFDDRHIWPEMLRHIKTYRPTWVIGENVTGITSMAQQTLHTKVESRTCYQDTYYDFYEAIYTRQEEMLLYSILEDLEAAGYAVQPFVIPACATDADHRRDRVWIVAHSTSKRCRKTGQSSGEPAIRAAFSGAEPTNVANSESNDRQRLSIGKEEKFALSGNQSQDVCNATSKRLPNWAGGEVGQPMPLTQFERSNRREVEFNFRGVPYGVSRRVDRLKSLGNAIVPQIATLIGHAILEAESLYD